MTKLETSDRPAWLQFSLRTLLAMLMLAASYFAGWVSHREWNKRNVDEVILSAAERIGGPVKVETPKDAPGVFVMRGKKDEVSEMEGAIEDLDAAARK